MSNKQVDKLTGQHKSLVHTEGVKVTSHTQREVDDWFVNTIMIENHNIAFKYKRKKLYQSLTGQRVNITYYPDIEHVANIPVDIMTIVRIRTY